jgi:Beta-lactamase
MLLPSSLISASAFLSIVPSSSAARYSISCPLLGPDYPPASQLSQSHAISAATQSLESSLKAALTKGTEYGQLDTDTTSFSINVYSITQATPLFTYHYSAPGLSKPAEGVAKVDSNTIFRIGSASKLWTVYLYLIEAGDVSFNEPITKYIPELATYAKTNAAALANDGTDITTWKDIYDWCARQSNGRYCKRCRPCSFARCQTSRRWAAAGTSCPWLFLWRPSSRTNSL